MKGERKSGEGEKRGGEGEKSKDELRKGVGEKEGSSEGGEGENGLYLEEKVTYERTIKATKKQAGRLARKQASKQTS